MLIIHNGKELTDHFNICHRMTLESYTNLHAAEIVKTVIVKTIEEKVRGLEGAAVTKKRKVMADPNSNQKVPKLVATASSVAKKAAELRMEAVIEGVVVQSMGPTDEAMNIQQQQEPSLPPQQLKNCSTDPNSTSVFENEKSKKSVEGQRRVTAYTLWSKWRKERMIQQGGAQSLTSPWIEWKAVPKAEKEVWQKEAKSVNNLNGQTQVRPPALNAYMTWASQHRAKLAQENPEENSQQVSKRLGAQWKSLSEGDKKPYIEAAKMSAVGKRGEINGNKSSKEEPARKESSDGKQKESLVLRFKNPTVPTTPPACCSPSGQGPTQQHRVESARKTLQPNPPGNDRYSDAVLPDHSYLPSSSLPKLIFRRNNSPKKSWGISAAKKKADSQQGQEQHGSRHVLVKEGETPPGNSDDDPKASTSG